MSPTLTTVDPILRVDDVCRLLKVSRADFYRLKKDPAFLKLDLLVEVLPRIHAHEPRYQGAPFVAWLSDRKQRALLQQTLSRTA